MQPFAKPAPRKTLNTFRVLAGLVSLTAVGLAYATLPAGLDSRALVAAYLNGAMPTTNAAPRPALLSATGAFTAITAQDLTPNAGLVPYTVNSPFWSDGAIKTRWIALPYDGTAASPQIGFAPTGRWTFPNGTVFVKHFELVVNEQTGAKRRLETRILVRDADGGIYGNSYRWRADNTDADIVAAPQNETITVIGPDGNPRDQNYLYPGPNDCLRCHNDVESGTPNGTGMVLGIKTRQLNGSFTYLSTGRTDNQLHTWNHLGMLSPGVPDQTAYPQFDKLVAVGDTSATLEHRVRSYLDANCSQCHRPYGPGPVFDARFDTPVLDQNLVGDGVSGSMALVRFNAAASRIHVRDSSVFSPMPPLGRNVVHQEAVDTEAAWVNYAYDVTSVYTYGDSTRLRVQFDRPVDPASAATPANYTFDNGLSVLNAKREADPRVVTLTTSAMAPGTLYRLKVNRVLEAQGPNNPIWPDTTREYTLQTAPAAGVLQFSNAHYTVDEGAGTATITVTRAGNSGSISVNYAATAGTAIANVDFTPVSGTLTWANGDAASKTFTVPIALSGMVEANKTVNLFLSEATGGAVIGAALSATLTIIDASDNPALPDFNADNKPDILWRHTPSGSLYVWYMNGISLISDALVTTVDPSWKMDGIADFNGDGHPDIVWRNGAGDTYVWYLVNGVFQSDAFLFSLPPEWVIQGVADFNADGKPDFLMRNVNSGNAFVWFFNNNVAIGDQFLFNIDPSWKVEGVADLNADNQPDLLFRNVNSGLAFAWNSQFSGGNLTLTSSSPPIFSIDSFWEVVQVADWNNDAKPDLLFRNRNTGVVFVWYLDGVTLQGSDFIIQIDPSWEIVPRR